jgi:hypothetical protein
MSRIGVQSSMCSDVGFQIKFGSKLSCDLLSLILLIAELSNFQLELILNLRLLSGFSKYRIEEFFLCYQIERMRLLSLGRVTQPCLSFSNN